MPKPFEALRVALR